MFKIEANPSTSNYFLPSLIETPAPTISIEEYESFKTQERNRFEVILNYLSSRNDRIHPGRVTSISNPCNNSLLGLAANSLCNIKQIAYDFILCGYGTCLTDPEPTQPTYLTEENYRSLNFARTNLYRNTCALCCIGPLIAIGLPFAIHVPPAAAKGLIIISNLSGYVITGGMTYFWGDFGARELAVFEDMKEILLKTSFYLEYKWMNLSDGDRNDYKEDVKQMAVNCEYMYLALLERQVSKAHAKAIIEPYSNVIRKILHNEYSSLQREREFGI